MALPQTLFQLTALLLLVVPGITFTAGRRYLRGPGTDEKDFSIRLVYAIAASVCFDSVYVIALGPWIVQMVTKNEEGRFGVIDHPRLAALAVLVLGLIVPLLAAFCCQLRIMRPRAWFRPWTVRIRKVPGRHPTPTAWDFIAPNRANCFIRIRTADSKWVGGYMPEKTGFVATYPEARDIFIPEQWSMSDDGEFLDPIDNSIGVYVPLTGYERVAFLAEPSSPAPRPTSPL